MLPELLQKYRTQKMAETTFTVCLGLKIPTVGLDQEERGTSAGQHLHPSLFGRNVPLCSPQRRIHVCFPRSGIALIRLRFRMQAV